MDFLWYLHILILLESVMFYMNAANDIRVTTIAHSVQRESYDTNYSPCSEYIGELGLEMNCFARGLDSVSSNWFPRDLRKLLLSSNQLTILHDSSFTNLTRLK